MAIEGPCASYQALIPSRSGAAAVGIMIGAFDFAADDADTALSFPSVPFSVDFSTCVALRERR
ncbi:hypothetical protein H1B27_20125 [Bradyrhizobium sp. CNPSo 4019]|uniref:Uncharacterized protein n=1 Tax=Bradyrhizobium diversitatis TaxID=2755406 RepID=A0ABS0P5P5_9BRAD|nr:hypothetical protein [Bradyrhizobium diversitatis]